MELRKDPITRSWVITGDDIPEPTPRSRNTDPVVNAKLNTLQTEDFILDTLLVQLAAIDTFNLNIDETSPFFAIRAKRSTIWALQREIYLWRNNYTMAKKSTYKVINYIGTLGWTDDAVGGCERRVGSGEAGSARGCVNARNRGS